MKKICKNCGTINEADARYCEKCGSNLGYVEEQTWNIKVPRKNVNQLRPKKLDDVTREFKVAPFEKRFWAWVIDLFVSWGILTLIIGMAGYMYGDPFLFKDMIFFYEKAFIFGIGSLGLVSFIYLVTLEYLFGNTIGKVTMNLSIISTSGQKPSFLAIVVNNIGKSFALIFDVFAAIFFVHYEEDETNLEQRVFQAIAGIVVSESPKSIISSQISPTNI